MRTGNQPVYATYQAQTSGTHSPGVVLSALYVVLMRRTGGVSQSATQSSVVKHCMGATRSVPWEIHSLVLHWSYMLQVL